MKKLILIAAAIMLIISACDNKEEVKDEKKSDEELSATFDSTALQTQEVKDEDQSFLMTYKFKTGETYKYRMTVFSQTEQTIEADTNITTAFDQTVTYIINFKPLSIDNDSVTEMQCNFSSVNLKASGNNGNEVSYQSGEKIDSSDMVKFAEYESFLNNPFNLRVSNKGEIVEIFKTDKIVNRFLDIRGLTDSVKADEKASLKQNLTTNLIRPLMIQVIREMPGKKVAKDSSWVYTKQTIPMMMVFQVEYTNMYNIESLEMMGDNKLAVIGSNVKTKITGEQEHTENGVKYHFEKPKSTASGKIYFDLDKGMILRSKTKTTLENSYSIEASTPQGLKKEKGREVISNTNVLELL